MTATFDIEFGSRLFRQNRRQAYSISRSTLVREVENYGRSYERVLDPGIGSGYIWRAASIARFVERDGGVYVEVEGMVLSRDIPYSGRECSRNGEA